MTSFFTVDRKGTLRPDLRLGLVRFRDIRPPELQTHVEALFPDGVSAHGDAYFLSSQSRANLPSPNIEILFEYVRRAAFPHLPSRFQSYFAFAEPEECVAFRSRYGSPEHSIWQVSCDSAFRADMSLLTTNGSVLEYSYWAHKYWQSLPSPIPIWEFLLTPPVQVEAFYAEPQVGA